MASWTFDESIRSELAEAVIAAHGDLDDAGGFVTGVMIGVVGYDAEGDPSYRMNVAGCARLLEMLGLAEALKMSVLVNFEGSPLNVDDDDD